MRLPLDWLGDFVDLPDSDPRVIADVLESLGHEVSDIDVVEPTFRGVVIGRVLEVGPHPDADKVRVCRVDLGGETSDIVCGAWNFEAGAVVPVAVPGSVIQGDFEIGRRKIRGVVSNGMICSEAELDVGDEAGGIMVLDGDYPEAGERLGEDFATLLPFPNPVLTVEITPNRPDCMSVLGLARELAARFDVPLRFPEVTVTEYPPATEVTIDIVDEVACPRFVAREVRNVTVGPAPHWMRMRLTAAGVRPINNVVDASNYVMIELGHPTHAFDLDRLGERIVVRRAVDGEQIVTLDDETRQLVASDIVVADPDRPVGIAGVMGGADTEVDDDSTRILVEGAYWDPPSILLTSKRLGLRSEASARFERGMDPNWCHVAVERVTQLLEGQGVAEAADGLADAYPIPIAPRGVALAVSEIPRHLGIDLDRDAIVGLLDRLGFDVEGDDPLQVTVPTRRPDVMRSIDLVEEVARLHGYDLVPERVATGPGGGLPVAERNLRRLREVMVGAGFHEALTFSFIGSADLNRLGLPEDDPRRTGITVTNPLRDEEGVMRTTLLPGLLKAAATNAARRIGDVALFETGKVFIPGNGELPEQPDHLAFVAIGFLDADWESPGRRVDVRDATGLWERLVDALRLEDACVGPSAAPELHPGRSAALTIGGSTVGVVGELHPRVASAFGLEGRVVVGEIELEPLVAERPPWEFLAPSPYPPVLFDLAFEVDDEVAAATVLEESRSAAGDLVERADIFDVFAGGPVPEGRKSIAVRFTVRSPERTLTDEEVAPVRRRIAESVIEATGGVLRGEV